MSVYSPQQLVDQINEAYFTELFSAGINAKERTAKLKLARQKLRIAKQSLRSEQTLIKQRWDNRNKQEAEQERLEIAPYNLVEAYIKRIEISYAELETALTVGDELPKPLGLATVIVGSPTMGGYQLSNKEDAEKWVQEKLDEQQAKFKQLRKQAFADAKQFIDAKNYINARKMLDLMPDVPLALEWLRKLDALELKQRQQLQQLLDQKKRRAKRNFIIFIAIVTIFLILFIAPILPGLINFYTPSKSVSPTQYIEPTRLAPISAVTIIPTIEQRFYPSVTPLSVRTYPTSAPVYSGGGSTCADGTHSSSTGRGTCSHHGGVAH